MKLKDFNFNNQETHIHFYVPKELVGDFAEYEYSRLRSFFQNGNKCYYYVDITVNNDNPKVLSDKTSPELFDAMQDVVRDINYLTCKLVKVKGAKKCF